MKIIKGKNWQKTGIEIQDVPREVVEIVHECWATNKFQKFDNWLLDTTETRGIQELIEEADWLYRPTIMLLSNTRYDIKLLSRAYLEGRGKL